MGSTVSFHIPSEEALESRASSSLRAVWRFFGFLAILADAALEWVVFIGFAGKRKSFRARGEWLHRVCHRIVRLLDLEAEYTGRPVAGGVLVCNHLSYLDVIVLASRQPLAFVAKKEVRSWPLIGRFAALGGTLFIDRERRGDVTRISAELSEVIAQGALICIFPEGTTSDGSDVLPFRSSLLEPAVTSGVCVTPAWIGYSVENGSAADEVYYWRDMHFCPHFFNLLGKRRVISRVRYGRPVNGLADRKMLAVHLRQEVRRLGGIATDPAFPSAE
ncbi:lysophospholipid acyltransferase family protein [Verrucomicrobiota bacterium sgz303538]